MSLMITFWQSFLLDCRKYVEFTMFLRTEMQFTSLTLLLKLTNLLVIYFFFISPYV